MTDHSRRIPVTAWLILPVVVMALLPWWRNHPYLRDLYDYGLVISGLGLLEQGQRPYVDFATPIQAGFFGLSWLVEKAGGGTYLALARGVAGLIVLMAAGFTFLLARRWSGWAASAVALAVTVASAGQHTILWHNSLGVFCLALVVWAAALAPVLCRPDWWWHGLVVVGLFIGGINKLNFHLVALAAALAWAWRAGLTKRAGWGAVGATSLVWLVVGGILPVAAELAWTGASLETWRHNVVELAVGSRAQTLPQIWSRKFLLTPIHDYYGPLLLPQVGLVGLILSLAALLGCWPVRAEQKTWSWDFLLLPVATILVTAAGAALLATNQDIAYLGLGAWLVLVTGLWLGFSPARRGAVFIGGLILPALLLAAAAWSSAWQGQRSQFGYSLSPRSSYLPAESAGPAFAYLAGLHLPPETGLTMGLLGKWLPEVQADGLRPVFYGEGTEWMSRFMPGLRQPGQPLWVHWDTTYGPRETLRLKQALGHDARYRVVLTSLARDVWPPEIRQLLTRYYKKDLFGPVTTRWTRRDTLSASISDSVDFINRNGGNVAGLILHTDVSPVDLTQTEDGRSLLGIRGGEGRLLLNVPTYRFGAEAVLDRASGAGQGPLHADFKVIVHGAVPEDVRWSARLELPAGQSGVTVPFKVDAMERRLLLIVSVPDKETGELAAGYRNLKISHAIESPDGAPRLRSGSLADAAMTPGLAEKIFADGVTWRPQQLVVRGGQFRAEGLELAAGGELWLHSEGMGGAIRGQLTCPDSAGGRPTVRVVWYKGGRLQIMQQGQMLAGQPFEFRAWCGEPGGWFGILLDPGAGPAPAQVRLLEAKFDQ